MKHFPSINRRLYTINSRVGETSKMKINDYENERPWYDNDIVTLFIKQTSNPKNN